MHTPLSPMDVSLGFATFELWSYVAETFLDKGKYFYMFEDAQISAYQMAIDGYGPLNSTFVKKLC
jgi:hypothetical protein